MSFVAETQQIINIVKIQKQYKDACAHNSPAACWNSQQQQNIRKHG